MCPSFSTVETHWTEGQELELPPGTAMLAVCSWANNFSGNFQSCKKRRFDQKVSRVPSSTKQMLFAFMLLILSQPLFYLVAF